jgi:16S rRNA (uracil1498-N3)-methyltransferase
LKQFLLPGWYRGESLISLTGEDFRYLARVLRKRAGDELTAVDAHGAAFVMRIVRVGRTACDAELAPAAAALPSPPGIRITLMQCLPKGRKIDLIVRQATEAGVARIVLVLSEHSQVRPDEKDARVPRLRKIAREALQQSGALRLPQIEEPRSLASIAKSAEEWGTALFFHERPLGGGTLHQLLAGSPRSVAILIGPEGGLSADEAALLQGAGFHPAYLGGSVLRVETAALYALGAVKTILQERDAWIPAQQE